MDFGKQSRLVTRPELELCMPDAGRDGGCRWLRLDTPSFLLAEMEPARHTAS